MKSFCNKKKISIFKRNLSRDGPVTSGIFGKFFDGPWSIVRPSTCILFQNGRRTHVSYRFNSVTARTRGDMLISPRGIYFDCGRLFDILLLICVLRFDSLFCNFFLFVNSLISFAIEQIRIFLSQRGNNVPKVIVTEDTLLEREGRFLIKHKKMIRTI